MNKVISLSIFGYNNDHKDCYSFNSFLRHLGVTIRAYKTLFFDWKIYLSVDSESYNAFKEYFDYILKNEIIGYLDILDSKSLCRNMLWRLNPIHIADYTICRDIDSLPTYRELQATQLWLNNGTAAHSINDSLGHSIPLLGGMVGFRKKSFDLQNIDVCGIDFSFKGADQDYLNKFILPIVNNSITEHRVLGMPIRAENPYSYNFIENIKIETPENVSNDIKLFFNNAELLNRCDNLVNHIGSGGFHLEPYYNDITERHYEGALQFWLSNCDRELNKSLIEIEKLYNNIFYWSKN